MHGFQLSPTSSHIRTRDVYGGAVAVDIFKNHRGSGAVAVVFLNNHRGSGAVATDFFGARCKNT